MSTVQASKFMSYVLRHRPDAIGLTLDAEGWATVDELVLLSQSSSTPLSRELVIEVVRSNDKQRFKLSDDELRIRASQGHSLAIDLALPPQQPPLVLYHGTASRFVESIREQGLRRGSRQHVHLSLEYATAYKVGQRHGKPVVFSIRAQEMFTAGHTFYVSDNGVWLTEHVPVEFLGLADSDQAGE